MGGIGRFVGLKLKTVALDPQNAPGLQNVLLVADDCPTEKVEGHTGFCDPDDAQKVGGR